MQDKYIIFFPHPTFNVSSCNQFTQFLFSVLAEELDKKAYDPEQAPVWCKTITEIIKEKIKGLGMDRYKVQ